MRKCVLCGKKVKDGEEFVTVNNRNYCQECFSEIEVIRPPQGEPTLAPCQGKGKIAPMVFEDDPRTRIRLGG